ncbi:hypothetical protein C2S52_001325 [Perilla frutescens var. hirtella]|nr:hypothetical protein C2S51_007192 [Perilla frutescens var. frutescens]KAH6800861.1 hypothetical protein C2S52_001325 [Perilla frutescens var. hirtella]
MAATAATVTPPPHKAEANTYADPSPQDLANQPSDDLPHSPKLETLSPPAPSPPVFLNSIAELKDLSAAISGFLHHYDDLHNHLDSIKAAILAKLPTETPHSSQPSPSPPSAQKAEIPEEIVREKQRDGKKPSISELEGLCKTMCSRGVRKYLASRLCNLPMLHGEVPNALRQAPNPSKLVLECLGKFYLQGSRAFTRNSPMIPAREASILVLECFLLMMGFDATSGNGLAIEEAVKEEADVAALAWRKRLVTEGGVAKACEIDARGLLLFVACFGIPASFKVEDVRDLVIAGNAKEIVGILQNSHMLMSKITEIVEDMMKKKMEVDAVDIVYTFGLEERFNPQTILISFLRESKETWKKPKKGSQGSAITLNEANKKQLATLKSISKCLERHGIDPAKLLPGWQINEKIATLEKDTTEFDRKSAQKRKSSETETSKKPKVQEAKRLRHVGYGPLLQKATGHVDARRNLSDSGLPKHVNSYGAPAVVYGGPGAGLLPESMIPGGVGATSHGGIHPTYAIHEGVLVDASGQLMNRGTHPYEGVLVDAAGQLVNRGTHPYVWPRDSSINERYTSQPQPVGLTTLYRASTSVEGFAGNATSSVGLGNQGSASDLYQFADSVAESELYASSIPRSVAAGSSAVPAHLQSYLYQA